MTLVQTSTLGYPRMGPDRALKFALEKYWKGLSTEEELFQVARDIEEMGWKLQQAASIDRITVGDLYLYDMVLTWSEGLGLCPQRFQHLPPGLTRLFAMARGVDQSEALSMKKWITSNYHYMVPEYDDSTHLQPDFSRFLADIERGVRYLGSRTATPVVLGPVSLAYLTKVSSSSGKTKVDLLNQLIPVYKDLLKAITTTGVTEIQVHEPALVFTDQQLLSLYKMAYPAVLPQEKTTAINMVASFMDSVGETHYQWLIAQPEFDIISLDLTSGKGETLRLLERFGFPEDKVLGAGMIDCRNVWKVDPTAIVELLQSLKSSKVRNMRIQPSGSLQYVPWDLDDDKELLGHPAAGVLAFAKQKLDEIRLVAEAARSIDSQSVLRAHDEHWAAFRRAVPAKSQVQWTERDLVRADSYETRRSKQLIGVPSLPTTTIGSFPQTAELRRMRALFKNGILSKQDYEAAMDQQIAYAIGIQEALGLDILVHGEAERTDMVEFFAEQMDGFLLTKNGWVQSFGSRCVRPPIIWTDISRPHPMTVREFQIAQALTSKPVKGMLTGPVTMLNWSFARLDLSRQEQAYQLAWAIRHEVKDLEAAGCRVIQVDEPALREGMPLRPQDQKGYLDGAVRAFLLATAGAQSQTQIHTHMCYCEFQDCLDAINQMDTDVNSIENARSGNETLKAFMDMKYTKGFGPGVYDIHSPVVPTVDAMAAKIASFLECVGPERLVINPDCGLKTRTWLETISALKNMVAATEIVRRQIHGK